MTGNSYIFPFRKKIFKKVSSRDAAIAKKTMLNNALDLLKENDEETLGKILRFSISFYLKSFGNSVTMFKDALRKITIIRNIHKKYNRKLQNEMVSFFSFILPFSAFPLAKKFRTATTPIGVKN